MNFSIDVYFGRISIYSIMILLSFIIGFAFASKYLYKKNLPKRLIFLLPFLNSLCAIFVALDYTYIFSHGIGLSSIGGVVGIFIGCAISGVLFKDYREQIWVAYCSVLPLMYSIAKLGCFFVGCCYGKPTKGYLTVVYTGDALLVDTPLIPIQLIESIVFFCIWLFHFRYSVIVELIICSIAKFILEFFRYEPNLINQEICIGLILILLILYIRNIRMVNKFQ